MRGAAGPSMLGPMQRSVFIALTISIIPIVLGAGIPLFGGTEHELALEGVARFDSGLVQLRYRCAPLSARSR